MALREKGKTLTLESALREAGFTVSLECCSRPSCFDYAARKDQKPILIKIHSDVDTFSSHDSHELRAIAKSMSAAPILVSEEAREKPIEDDTIYSRHHILALNSRTFENLLLHGTYPLIQAGPGGYYVEVDGTTVKRRREQLDMSTGEMAEMMGISRRTLYGYERGMAKASVTVAYRLMWALGVPVAKPINIFERAEKQRKCILTPVKHAIARNKLLQKIFRKLDRYNITTVKKAPFDFVINIAETRIRIIGGVANQHEKELDRRIDEILSVSKIVKAHPVLVTEGQRLSDKDIHCIRSQEIAGIRKPEDLINRV